MNQKFMLRVTLFAIAGGVLTACGGSTSSGSDTLPDQAVVEGAAVPNSALQSNVALTTFVLSQSESDTQEPLTINPSVTALEESTDEPVSAR